MIVGIRRTVSAYGTVTRSAPAGRRPPKPSLQIHLFMNLYTAALQDLVTSAGVTSEAAAARAAATVSSLALSGMPIQCG